MKIIPPKKSGRRYMLFTVLSVVFFTFFLTSNFWISLRVKSKSVDYDVILKQNDYNIKITAASYHDGICEFTLKCKLMKENSTQSYPEVTSVRFNDNSGEFVFSTGEKYDDYSQIITVKNPPSEFKYMIVTVTSKMADIQHED